MPMTRILIFNRDRLHEVVEADGPVSGWRNAIARVRTLSGDVPGSTAWFSGGHLGQDRGGKRTYRRGDFKAVEGVR